MGRPARLDAYGLPSGSDARIWAGAARAATRNAMGTRMRRDTVLALSVGDPGDGSIRGLLRDRSTRPNPTNGIAGLVAGRGRIRESRVTSRPWFRAPAALRLGARFEGEWIRSSIHDRCGGG